MAKYTLKTPKKVLLLASYCDSSDNNGCTNKNPCKECIQMCNVAIIPKGTEIEVLGELEYINRKSYSKSLEQSRDTQEEP